MSTESLTSLEPRPTFGEGEFVTALAGAAGVARLIHALAAPDDGATSDRTTPDASDHPTAEPDDFVDLLLGVASLGASIDELATPAATPPERVATDPEPPEPGPSTPSRAWLR